MTVSDLSPDALARLEAKLVADLEMVRKVRALLEEHRPRADGQLRQPVTVSAAAMPATGAPVQAPAPGGEAEAV
jgi:hypothetical protein